MTNSKKDTLYRIVKFDHAVDILKNGQLHFSHPSLWDDPYEVRIQHEYQDSIFAQCWCKKSLSDAMWRIYSPDRLGVRIRTTREKIKQAVVGFIQDQKENNLKYQYRLTDVKYKTTKGLQGFTKTTLAQSNGLFSPATAANLLCAKRNAFEHEAEVRILLYREPKDEHEKTAGRFLKVPVDGHSLIDSILIDPRAPEDLYLALKKYLKESIGYSGVIAQSELYRTPPIHVIEPIAKML